MPNVPMRPTIVVSNGNTVAILGQVTRALKRTGEFQRADEVRARVLSSTSYDQALGILMEYADLDLTEDS